MTFRSEGDLVYAANAARDLNNLVVAYLNLYKKYAQGMNGLTVPTGKYAVVILGMKETKLHVKMVFEEVSSYQSPVYCDLDDDDEHFGYGGPPISHYEEHFTTSTVDKGVLIPFVLLLQTKEKMEESVKSFAENEKNRLREKDRLARIAEHQEEIRKLQEVKP